MSSPDQFVSPLGALFVSALRTRDASLRPRILDVVRPAVEEAPDGTVLVLRARTPVVGLRQHRHLVRKNAGSAPLADLACLADAVGLLDERDVDAVLESLPPPHRAGLLRQRIHRLVQTGQLDEAHRVAGSLPEPLRGHRDVGLHLARAGDVEAFFAEWSRLEPRRETAELVALREELVGAVARERGWRAALSLVDRHARLGDRYAFAALSAFPVAAYDELVPLLDGELAPRLDEDQRVTLLVDQLLREVPEATREGEDPRVATLAERIGALDGDRDVVRARDGQLVRLWPLVAEEATLRRIRALVRTPGLRRELSGLLRDLARPS